LALTHESDAELIARAGRGDRLAASEIVMRYSKPVYAICYRMVGAAHAEDATQETFMRMWRTAPKWNDTGSKFSSWLFKVATNVCLDHLRKRKREAPEDAAPEQVDRGTLADEQLMQQEQREMVEKALLALPYRQRIAITLCHLQELGNIEAAKIMDVSVEALESLLSRGRRKLKSLIVRS
jgi:RNA polymerase sigma-70 factor (ECF subfamily)